MGRLATVFGVVLVITLLIGCGQASRSPSGSDPASAIGAPLPSSAPAAKQPEFVLKEGHIALATHPHTIAAKRFSKLVARRTEGRVRIDVYDNAQLGKERELADSLRQGNVDLAILSTGSLGQLVPDSNVLDLPYLFRDEQHAHLVLDGPVGADILRQFQAQGIVGLAFWEDGYSHLTNSKLPIYTPADLKGLRIRTMENKVHAAIFRVLGAEAIPMARSDALTSTAKGLLDGQDNPISIIYDFKIYESQGHLALTGHFYSAAPLLMSKKTWEKMPPEIQAILIQAATEVASYERVLIKEQEERQLEELKAKGVRLTVPDIHAFRQATLPVYAEFESQFGAERITAIREAN